MTIITTANAADALKRLERELASERDQLVALRRERDAAPNDSPERRRAASAIRATKTRIEVLQGHQKAALAMLGDQSQYRRNGIDGPQSGDYFGSDDGWHRAAHELNLQAGRNRIDLPAADLLRSPALASLSVTPSEGLTAPALITPFSQQAQARQFIYPSLAQEMIDIGMLAITDFKQTGSRTVTGEVERDPMDATTDKATLALGIELETPSLRQFAAVADEVPAKLFDVQEVMLDFLRSELQYQLDIAIDQHVVAQIVAATPPHGKSGTGLIERVRNGVAAMQSVGANPTVLALSPSEAAALDLTKTELGYIFATRDSGSASPLWGLTIVPAAHVTVPLLIDPTLLGVLYTQMGRVLVDPYSGMKKNLVALRVEVEALFHVRQAAGAYLIE